MAKQKMLKTPLFDRIFKPELITLPNGHTVERPRSRTPWILLLFTIVVIISIRATGFNLSTIITRIKELTVILSKIFHPNFKYFSKVISPLIETIQMSIVGTIIGSLIGLPLAILASSNINKNKPILLVCRFILSVLRSIPTLIYAYIFALIFSLGSLAGTVAIAVFTIGIVAKMLYESIETIDMGPYEAMQSFGASTLQSFWAACMPQILPTYLADCLYCFEINVRASSILGYVGAGGLGILIRERTGLRAYSDLGMILITLFVVVWLIDMINDYLRSKLS
ncbi:phosphonate ABC transporter, permease protein PhnE [Solobacterium sp.]|uniref:phosphonate ABC transporter, permease protein PhnE n=1 Tax=Solobacterium sp. TaxID=2060878 RepID=UPI001CB031E3|nr:phosphonate ABC transporter, permease protein PhnE [Solobacterium sp.]MBF1085482.1 phosphonate ABC transporter, permease protein PhnE [Solobacterium sp.]